MSDATGLPFSAAAERNREPILAELRQRLPRGARVLEIASGTGQHAAHFAAAGPGWDWQPSDAQTAMLPVIDARCAGQPGVRPALRLDVTEASWPLAPGASFDAVYCANLLHIAPWAACPALMAGAAAVLAPGGLLLLYGPFRVDGVPTAPSNEAFDADLRARDPAWGLRSLGDVQAQAQARGLVLEHAVALPANNRLVVFRKERA